MQEHPDKGVDPTNGRKVARSNTLFGWNTIYGRDGDHGTPYMTRIWFGRLRMHIFHRGDADPDCHDHPWDFWTFPLTSYVEEVAVPDRELSISKPLSFWTKHQVVPAFRVSFRSANHCHRVLGRYERDHSEAIYGFKVVPGKIVTIVWRGGKARKWGFLKHRDGKWCWVHWKDYVFGGGKDSPCQ